MGAIEKPTVKTIGLVLLLGAAVPNWAAAQEAAPENAFEGQETPVVDLGEIDALLESIRARVDGMNATAADTDAAMSFLSDQVEAAIHKLSTGEFETEELRKTTRGLADELQTVASNRDQLGFQVTRLTEEKVEIFARLESQVRDLATLLSLEREVATNLRLSLEGRSGELRASLKERDRTAAELSESRVTLATGQAQSERQILHLAALESDIAELRDDRTTMAARLDRTADELVSTRESLDGARARSQELEQNLTTASLRNDALSDEVVATTARGDGLIDDLTVSQSQIEALSQQLAALRAQIAELNGLLQTSDGQTKLQQAEIADLGRRLNLALATKVRELARYRSEFLGRLRAVLGERADVRVVGDRFVFQSEVLFATGEAELEAPGRTQLLGLAESLKEIGATIPGDIDWVLRVDGHTDARPIQTPQFPSNWELSTARAISVVRFLIDQNVPAERVMAAGFAHFRPLDPGDGEDAFRRNRRIEFRLTQK
jgi:chemotaxis protein MotB